MELPLAMATYFICWWMALFFILPWGVKTQAEAGDIVPGSAESAPHNSHILKKMLATCFLGGIFFAIAYFVITQDTFSYEDVPFLPDF